MHKTSDEQMPLSFSNTLYITTTAKQLTIFSRGYLTARTVFTQVSCSKVRWILGKPLNTFNH